MCVPHVLIVVCGKNGTLASYLPEGTDGCSDKASWKIFSLTSKSTRGGISDSSVDPWEGLKGPQMLMTFASLHPNHQILLQYKLSCSKFQCFHH